MKIAKNTVVALTYELKLDDGELVDAATSDKLFSFIHEAGQTLPAFDSNLAGLSAGDSFSFKIAASEGYGEYNQDFVRQLDASIFTNAPKDILFIGSVLPMMDQEGNPLEGEILEITDEYFTIDFNHPLAGEDLNFSGKVFEVRPATNEELDHGHVHGPHGHHH